MAQALNWLSKGFNEILIQLFPKIQVSYPKHIQLCPKIHVSNNILLKNNSSL